jgi:hypothetical protein
VNMKTEYMPATYTNILDQMLSRGAEPGQGGHLEGSPDDVSRVLARVDCFPFLATEVANVFGMDRADSLLRNAVRRQGRYRGNEIRREVESRGLPLDAQHLVDYWDFSRKLVPKVYNAREPHYVAFDVCGCAFHDQMKDLCPQRLAVSMCEVSHIAVAAEFNPAIEVWYPALLTRGQAKCDFRFSMPREAAEKAALRAQQLSEAAREAGKPLAGERQPGEAYEAQASTSYRSMARVTVSYYHHIAGELAGTVGTEQTEDILRRAMRKWGAWRGKEMREDHQKRGWPLNLESFITYYDVPAAGDAWMAENVKLTPSEHTKDITISPFTTMFEQFGTGRFALPMYEEGLPAQAEAYNPAIQVAIPKLMERGDSISRFCYKMAP